MTSRSVMGALAVCAAAVCAVAQPQWYSVGLEGESVNCLLVDDTTKVLAGTDNGLWLQHGDSWVHFEGALSANAKITALVRLPSGDVIAAFGGGTYSDGIYRGVDVFDGAPFYEFSLVEYIVEPTALAVGGHDNDTLYVGTGRTIHCAEIRSDGAVGALTALGTPQGAFGVEMPHCAALYQGSEDGRLYAGGYDFSPEPGPGHVLGSLGDTLEVLKQADVTAMAEGVFAVEGLGPRQIAFGTLDTGILYFAATVSSEPWSWYDSPNSEPVVHLVATPSLIWSDYLYVSVASGVYYGYKQSWSVVGSIPHVANVLAVEGYEGPWAGTDNGVYRYGEPPVQAVTTGRHSRSVLLGRQPRSVVLGVGVGTGPGCEVFDLYGRRLGSSTVSAAVGSARVAVIREPR